MAFNLKTLYHPSGLTGGIKGHRDFHHCPCGCNPTREYEAFEQGAKQLGIVGTPGLLVEAELDRRKRAATPKPVKRTKPWKGATVSRGQVKLPVVSLDCDGHATNACTDPECPREHVTRVYNRREARVHVGLYDARIYTMPNGAVARVRADVKKGKL